MQRMSIWVALVVVFVSGIVAWLLEVALATPLVALVSSARSPARRRRPPSTARS